MAGKDGKMTRRKLRKPEYNDTQDLIDRLKDSPDADDADNIYEIRKLERRLDTLRSKSDFLQQDYIRDLVKRIKSVIVSTTRALQEEDDPKKRISLKSDRAAFYRLLTWFSDDIESDLSSINARAEQMLS